MIDKHPRVIVRCVDVADVIAAVRFGVSNNLLTAIRGGGHNGAGLGTCDDGLVIDMSRMKGVRVDPAERSVRVEAGCVWWRRRSRDPRFRYGDPQRFYLFDWRYGSYTRRRNWLPDAPLWIDHRQSALRGCGPRGRPLCHSKR